MIFITGLAGLVGRFAGRVLNSALGWATILLFGQVRQSRQMLLLLVTLGSLASAAALAGVFVPTVGTFLIALVPSPDFVDEAWIRLAMLAIALLLPLFVGIGGLFLVDAYDRPRGRAAAMAVARGYPLTLVLAVTLVMLSVIALWTKALSLGRRWTDAHVPIVLKPGGYERLVAELDDALDRWGLPVDPVAAPRALSIPGRLLAAVGGPGVRALVPQRLLVLRRPDLQVLVYPSDVAMSGRRETVARARAAIAIRLPRAPAYLTISREAEQVEERLGPLAASSVTASSPAAREALKDIDRRLHELAVPFEEWETLYRQRLQVERDMLARAVVSPPPPLEPSGPATPPQPEQQRSSSWPEWAAAAVGFGLIALDVGLLVLGRVSAVRDGPNGNRRGWPWAR